MEIDEEDEEEEEEVYFSAQDLLGMREDVAGLVRTLLKLLEKFSLRDKPQSADSCVRVSGDDDDDDDDDVISDPIITTFVYSLS